MSDQRIEMSYTAPDGGQRKIRESTIRRLRHVKSHGSVGRLQAPGVWKANEIRALEDQGLAKVDWVEPGDLNREGGWVIQGLTPLGVELLEKWERVVERGEATKGPRRGQAPQGL